MKFLAIDPSINSTGYCIRELDSGKISTKGSITNDIIPKDDFSCIKRIQLIVNFIVGLIETHDIKLVVLEDLNLGVKSRSISGMAGLNYILRFTCILKKLPYIVMPPTSWKMLYLDNGHASKEDILQKVNYDFKLGLEEDTQDIADALGISEAYRIMLKFKKNIDKLNRRIKTCIEKLIRLQDID